MQSTDGNVTWWRSSNDVILVNQSTNQNGEDKFYLTSKIVISTIKDTLKYMRFASPFRKKDLTMTTPVSSPCWIDLDPLHPLSLYLNPIYMTVKVHVVPHAHEDDVTLLFRASFELSFEM